MDSWEQAVTLMAESPAAVLTTIGEDGFPRSRAMLNLRRVKEYPSLASFFSGHSRDLALYFTTNTSSDKIRQIRNNPRVSVYYCRPGEWRGLSLYGEIEIIEDSGIKGALWQDGWAMYYPEGVTDPDYAILRLRPVHAAGYHKMKRYEIDF